VACQDGYLHCPSTPWGESTSITLTCEVLKSACSGFNAFEPSATFHQASLQRCEVNTAQHSVCLQIPTASEPSSGCYCMENATTLVYKYKFTAQNPGSSGSWTCKRGCYIPSSNPMSSDLNIVSDADCTATVQGKHFFKDLKLV
jgi:hypothetical protein